MVEVISKEEFRAIWKKSSILGCPKIKGWFSYWLYPLRDDPCVDCPFRSCHNNGIGFDEKERLWVPEESMPDLLLDVLREWLETWKNTKGFGYYKEVREYLEKLEKERGGRD